MMSYWARAPAAAPMPPRWTSRRTVRCAWNARCIARKAVSAAIVAAVVADVKVERDGIQLRPGMHREVRFRQHQRAGGAGSGKLVEGRGHDLQAGVDAGAAAQRGERVGLQQQAAVAGAVVEFGKDVEAVHSEVAKDTPSRRIVRSAASTPR